MTEQQIRNLYKKLKEVGFPQPKIIYEGACWGWNGYEYCFDCGASFYFYDEDGEHWSTTQNDFDSEEDVFIPTLEQLIEACGDGFVYLRRDGENQWWARRKNGDQTEDCNSPEEAVANLYIALNS